MINRYRKSIISLLDNLHEARKKPFENIEKWLFLQESLIKKTVYVETRIRENKLRIKEINKYRKTPNQNISKLESNSLKERLKVLKYQIEEYRWILDIYQSIGDGIAYTFIHKLDIKPLNFKESAGFLSGKKGFILEKKILRIAYKKNQIAILNDLTSVLKYADITLINENGINAIEVKSSNIQNKRVKRQAENSKKVFDYLSTDITTDLYGTEGVMQRKETSSPEINYTSKFNKLIKKCSEKGIQSEFFENGLLFVVAHNHFNKDEMNNVFFNSGLDKPFAVHLNMHKFTKKGYFPFSLSFNKSNYYWDFLEGKLNVFMFFEFKTIEKIAERNGFIVEQSNEEQWAFNFINKNNAIPVSNFNISEHYFSRTFMEFVSLEWLIQDMFNQFNNLIKELEKKKK
ncbi:hypothetical protein [Arenibacter sp. ARW7G5Y1]|uniref:hypothetical protein n=1 Tax=Arenibacter sp. ARW7G5Y1 TaxID=2135619 RepID=UPI000D75DB5B|nr:hypothetical protein [Arenibacter sp. ARW7G5Y1]PXX30623.1 hypothetical protein C7972_102250 [Arenibacter sp. ARW7G5Y1]